MFSKQEIRNAFIYRLTLNLKFAKTPENQIAARIRDFERLINAGIKDYVEEFENDEDHKEIDGEWIEDYISAFG